MEIVISTMKEEEKRRKRRQRGERREGGGDKEMREGTCFTLSTLIIKKNKIK